MSICSRSSTPAASSAEWPPQPPWRNRPRTSRKRSRRCPLPGSGKSRAGPPGDGQPHRHWRCSRPAPPCSKPHQAPEARMPRRRDRRSGQAKTGCGNPDVFRKVLADAREAYGGARLPCEDWSVGRSRTPINCSKQPSRFPAIATRWRRTALELALETPRSSGRASSPPSTVGLGSLEPAARRPAAFAHLGKDDSSLQDVLITLIDDPDRSVRMQAWGSRGGHAQVKKSRSRTYRTTGSGGGRLQRLPVPHARGRNSGIERPRARGCRGARCRGPDNRRAPKQAADLQKTARELREKIDTLKSKPKRQGRPGLNQVPL